MAKRSIDARFWIGDIVYRRTDTDQMQGLVISVTIFPSGAEYEVSFDGHSSSYYELELDSEPNWKVNNKDSESA